MSPVADDTVKQFANLIASALKNLDENLIRVTQDSRYALSRIVSTGLLQNQFDLLSVEMTRGATCVKTLNKHDGLSLWY